MVRDLNMPVEVVGVPTVREADGLAMSSRNRLLSADERRAAPALYRALRAACDAISAGETSPESARRAVLAVLEREPAFRAEYVEIVDDEMQPVDRIDGAVTVAVAAWLGSTRLIDNVQCRAARQE
jgi:pantoate--beta-alanine ligase